MLAETVPHEHMIYLLLIMGSVIVAAGILGYLCKYETAQEAHEANQKIASSHSANGQGDSLASKRDTGDPLQNKSDEGRNSGRIHMSEGYRVSHGSLQIRPKKVING